MCVVVFYFLVCKMHLAKTKINNARFLSFFFLLLLRGWRLKGKGKGVLGARETRGAREEGGREGNACQETIVFLVFNIHRECYNPYWSVFKTCQSHP